MVELHLARMAFLAGFVRGAKGGHADASGHLARHRSGYQDGHAAGVAARQGALARFDASTKEADDERPEN